MSSIFSVLFILGLLFSGCDYKFSETSQSENNTNGSNSQTNRTANSQSNTNINAANLKTEVVNIDEPLILSGTSQSASHTCGGRSVEIVSDATANSYTLKGECKKLTVDGVSNTVNVEKVGEISVKGISNKVIYVEGIGGKKPKITKNGTSTSVDSQESLDKKKAAEIN